MLQQELSLSIVRLVLEDNGDHSGDPEKEVTNDLILKIRDMSKPIKFSILQETVTSHCMRSEQSSNCA